MHACKHIHVDESAPSFFLCLRSPIHRSLSCNNGPKASWWPLLLTLLFFMTQYWPSDYLIVTDDIWLMIEKQHGCALDSRFQACFDKQQSTLLLLQPNSCHPTYRLKIWNKSWQKKLNFMSFRVLVEMIDTSPLLSLQEIWSYRGQLIWLS